MTDRILVVDDDEKIVRILTLQLEHFGFEVVSATDGVSAIEAFRQDPTIQICLIDVMLPGIDGLELCRQIKKVRSNVKVLMVSAKGRSVDIVEGLESGADDYVKKPFVFDELLARIKANLRSLNEVSVDDNIIRIKDLEVDKQRFTVKRNGEEINLSKTEFDLLYYLCVNHGIVLSKEQLLENVWGEDFEDTGVVEVYIKYLRDKIDKEYDEKLIVTSRGRGYVIG